jgi:hypothetical protein
VSACKLRVLVIRFLSPMLNLGFSDATAGRIPLKLLISTVDPFGVNQVVQAGCIVEVS